jgi:hypothetical protein
MQCKTEGRSPVSSAQLGMVSRLASSSSGACGGESNKDSRFAKFLNFPRQSNDQMNRFKFWMIRLAIFVGTFFPSTVYTAQCTWEAIMSRFDMELLHSAADIAISAMGGLDSGNKFIQLKFIQSIVSIFSTAVAAAFAFATLWLFELWRHRREAKNDTYTQQT